MPSHAPSLRERKKQRTRRHIAETARELFAEHGFEQVPISEIARAADVSEGTVFNYFPSKEDLVYGRMEEFERDLLDAIRNRGGDESLIAAFGRFILTPRGFLASPDPAVAERLRAITRVIAESPTLLAREQQILDRYTSALADLIEEESGRTKDATEAWVAANALLGVHRALLAYVRQEIIAGTPTEQIRRGLKRHGRRALGMLEQGIQ